ncbi:MAG: DNA primase [Candidatus Portnoybacteria bacterium]|nr:DNA primase [Candidatus Portnoybacteria bacterium]
MTDVDEIKRRLNIVDVIGDYVKLSKAGGNWRARCPFHSEKTPSFFVSPERQIWHCFGACSKGGDIFRFLMEAEGLEFGEVLRMLAKKAGVELAGFDRRAQDKKSLLIHINELATLFFQKALEKTGGGQKAMAYLKKRGVNDQSIERFKLGFAPSSWHALLTFLEKRGYKRDDIVLAGLAVKNDEGRIYDRFRARIMFPIQNIAGIIVGFTGRTLLDDVKEAKYINTPQTLLYDKSRELYGIYQAKQAIKSQDAVLFVEGNLDVILSSQAGVENVAATSGTAFTPGHLETVSRYTKNVTFCFDNDQAGELASRRAFEIALQGNFEAHSLSLDGSKDPAELVVKEGNEAWQTTQKKKIHVMEFLWAKGLKAHDAQTLKGKKALINDFFHFLSFIPSQVERGYWLQEISRRLSVREEDVFQEFQKFEKVDSHISKSYNDEEKSSPIQTNRAQQDFENLLALTLAYPHLGKEMNEAIGIERIKREIVHSEGELLLKAEVFWPTENLAKRELERIINNLAFMKKKEEIINDQRPTTDD